MNRRAQLALLLTTVGGLAVAGWTIGRVGIVQALDATMRIGVGGFAIYCLWTLAVFGLLGAAWLSSAPGERAGRVGLFSWARMVREAASDLLPFSQLGGLALSTRMLRTSGVPSARVYSSVVVDLTTEMASQVIYTLFGLALMASLLAGAGAAASLRPLILGGTGVMVLLVVAFLGMQRLALGLASALAARFLPRSAEGLAGVRDELARTYAQRRRVLLAFVFNLISWVASGAGAWIVLRLMAVAIPIWQVLSLESLIFTLRSIAFFVPGAIGVQEAAYAIAAHLFGLSPETALALSLVKRAREIAIGVPTLVIWQLRELRAISATSRTAVPLPAREA